MHLHMLHPRGVLFRVTRQTEVLFGVAPVVNNFTSSSLQHQITQDPLNSAAALELECTDLSVFWTYRSQ